VLGESLTPVTVTYTVVAAPPRVPGDLLTSAPVDAGTYQVAARFAGNANYNQKQSAPQTITINKAATSTVVTVTNATYDGNPHGGTATVTGPASLNQALTVTYTGVAPTVYAASTTAPTNAGTYSASASYAESANYLGSSDTKTFTINKKTASVTPDPVTKLLGAPDPPLTGTLTGFLASDGVTATYSRVLGESVGSYTISATLLPAAILSNYTITYNTAVFSIIYNWSGFFQPVDNLPTINSVNAGRAIPVKFSLHGNQGLGIFLSGYPSAPVAACDAGAPVATIEETTTAGNSSLSYDPGSDQYIYVWKTDKAWAGQCRQLIIKLNDNSTHWVIFKFTK
jgi:hypothetical protein